MSRYTPQQEQAITWPHNLSVTAGAGAGKTRVLVERFLHWLEQPDTDLEDMVAITFTERAAREMRGRVREELYRRAAAGGPAERQHARRMLERLERARISTFHSFRQALLRAYPVEAALDPDFRLIDELESGLLLAEAVEAVLDAAVAEGGEPAVDLFSRFSRTALADGLAGLVADLRNLGLTPEQARQLTRQTLADQAAGGGERRAALAAAVTAVATRGSSARGAAMARDFQAAWERLYTRLPELDGGGDGAAALLAELAGLAGALDGRSVTGKDELKAALAELEAAAANPEAGRLAETLLDLAQAALNRLEVAKAAASLLDFGDLVERTGRLLAAHPAIRAGWRERCRWVMVDEFQDTDTTQWRVIGLLLGDPLPADRLFLVGDVKQSIYRFRGARVELFGAARAAISATAGGGEVDLGTNFRSQGSLIAFANHTFSRLIPGYVGMRAHRPQRERAVELLLPAPQPDGAGRVRPAPREREAELLAARIAAMVRGAEELVWAPATPGGEEAPRPVRWGDVAILLQAMTHVNTYALALARAGIPHYVVAGNGFFGQQEILDVSNLLAVLDNPADGIALLGVLRSPYVSLSDEAVYRMGQHRGGLAGALADAGLGLTGPDDAALEGARTLLTDLRRIVWQEPLPGVLPAVYAASGIYPVLLARPDGERRVANLEKLADRVRSFGASGRRQFADLLRWLRVCMGRSVREGLAATEDESGDTVRLMTVHQAKGVEFPAVCLPDLGRRQLRRSGAFLLEPGTGLAPVLRDAGGGERRTALREAARRADEAADGAEFRRQFYVAATRARDFLLLSGRPAPTAADNPPETWLQWLADACGADLAASPGRVDFGGVTAVVTAPAPDGPGEPGTLPALPEPAVAQHPEFRRAPGFDPVQTVPPEVAALMRRVRPVAAARQRDGLQVAVTRLLDLQDCARKYYLKYVLAVPDLRGGSPAPVDADLLPAAETALEPTLRGQIVHAVCERLSDPAELDALVHQAAADFRTDPDTAAFAREVWTPLRRYAGSAFFARVRTADRVLSEVPVRMQVGDLVLEGQIDKLLITGSQAVVADFKTNQVETPAAIAATAAHYRLQMEAYALAVTQQMDLPVADAVLYFLVPGQAVPIAADAAVTRQRLEAMGRTLAGAHGWGDFPPNADHCPHCQYREFCRVSGEQ